MNSLPTEIGTYLVRFLDKEELFDINLTCQQIHKNVDSYINNISQRMELIFERLLKKMGGEEQIEELAKETRPLFKILTMANTEIEFQVKPKPIKFSFAQVLATNRVEPDLSIFLAKVFERQLTTRDSMNRTFTQFALEHGNCELKQLISSRPHSH